MLGISGPDGKIVIDGMMPGKYKFNVGQGELQKREGRTFYRHGILGRWWSDDGANQWSRKQIFRDGWQNNVEDLAFDLSVDMQPVTIEIERGVTFSGHVYDPNGKPVAGATVVPTVNGPRYSVQTDKDGSYRMVTLAGKEVAYNLIAHDGGLQESAQMGQRRRRAVQDRAEPEVRKCLI